jgi:transaldolase/glucose-6-phosphate isomerase
VLVSDDALDLPVPGTSYTFGAMKRAQALGDCQVLAARHRRLLRVEIGGDIRLGLRRLREWIEAALAQRMQ